MGDVDVHRILLGAQGCLREDLHSDALVYRAIECRSEMLASGPVTHDNAMSALAVEVAYDCALLNLCAAEDIGAFPADFSLPHKVDDVSNWN